MKVTSCTTTRVQVARSCFWFCVLVRLFNLGKTARAHPHARRSTSAAPAGRGKSETRVGNRAFRSARTHLDAYVHADNTSPHTLLRRLTKTQPHSLPHRLWSTTLLLVNTLPLFSSLSAPSTCSWSPKGADYNFLLLCAFITKWVPFRRHFRGIICQTVCSRAV